jgi:hypothetical protein
MNMAGDSVTLASNDVSLMAWLVVDWTQPANFRTSRQEIL